MILRYGQLAAMVEEAIANSPFTGNPERLYRPMNYMMELGGKRVRPVLALMGCQLSGAEASAAMPQALAMEVFHNFTLVHDDIMDQAPLRRGQETVYRKWDMPTAILSGDNLLIKSYELLAQCEPARIPALLKMFSETATGICEGQQMDMDFESRADVRLEEYLEMIRLKTAVLLGCSLYCGMLAGGGEHSRAMKLYDAGVQLGVAFQILDDVIDTFGNPEKTGKQAGGDILSDKKTCLRIMAMNSGDAGVHDLLLRWNGSGERRKVEEVTAAFISMGIREKAEALANDYFSKGEEILNSMDFAAEMLAPLNELIAFLRVRDY